MYPASNADQNPNIDQSANIQWDDAPSQDQKSRIYKGEVQLENGQTATITIKLPENEKNATAIINEKAKELLILANKYKLGTKTQRIDLKPDGFTRTFCKGVKPSNEKNAKIIDEVWVKTYGKARLEEILKETDNKASQQLAEPVVSKAAIKVSRKQAEPAKEAAIKVSRKQAEPAKEAAIKVSKKQAEPVENEKSPITEADSQEAIDNLNQMEEQDRLDFLEEVHSHLIRNDNKFGSNVVKVMVWMLLNKMDVIDIKKISSTDAQDYFLRIKQRIKERSEGERQLAEGNEITYEQKPSEAIREDAGAQDLQNISSEKKPIEIMPEQSDLTSLPPGVVATTIDDSADEKPPENLPPSLEIGATFKTDDQAQVQKETIPKPLQDLNDLVNSIEEKLKDSDKYKLTTDERSYLENIATELRKLRPNIVDFEKNTTLDKTDMLIDALGKIKEISEDSLKGIKELSKRLQKALAKQIQ